MRACAADRLSYQSPDPPTSTATALVYKYALHPIVETAQGKKPQHWFPLRGSHLPVVAVHVLATGPSHHTLQLHPGPKAQIVTGTKTPACLTQPTPKTSRRRPHRAGATAPPLGLSAANRLHNPGWQAHTAHPLIRHAPGIRDETSVIKHHLAPVANPTPFRSTFETLRTRDSKRTKRAQRALRPHNHDAFILPHR